MTGEAANSTLEQKQAGETIVKATRNLSTESENILKLVSLFRVEK